MNKNHTPHINANPEDFAKTVLMPGDPLRSKFIAENFLTDAKLVNNVRGIQGYTGYYNGKRVSVMASGMGMPSIGIYSYELFNFFGVENIIRIGSAGGISEKVKMRDIIVGMGACTTSNYAVQYGLEGTYAPIASYELVKAVVEEADKLGAPYAVGNLLSSDIFYNACPEAREKWTRMGVLGVDPIFQRMFSALCVLPEQGDQPKRKGKVNVRYGACRRHAGPQTSGGSQREPRHANPLYRNGNKGPGACKAEPRYTCSVQLRRL